MLEPPRIGVVTMRLVAFIAVVAILPVLLVEQTIASHQLPPAPLRQAAEGTAVAPDAALEEYRIGPEDLIEISVFEVPEMSRTVRVSASGLISLPMIGSVKAVGLSPRELEQALGDVLRKSYIKDPQVAVFIREYRSYPISVMGAVKSPGLYYIQTRKGLVEVLSMAGGFAEGARQPGRTITITRRANVRSTGAAGAPGGGSAENQRPAAMEVPVKELVEGTDPKWNVPIYPGDDIRVSIAGVYYVAGDVNRPGAFQLSDFDKISALQALAIAGGTKRTASSKNAVIIRRDAAGKKVEEKIDLSRVLKGKDTDTTLGANDILFVPGSVGKESALRAIETGLSVGTGILVYRGGR